MFKYDVFYHGQEGFEEHIQAETDDAGALAEGRTAVMVFLKLIEAQPRGAGRYISGSAPKVGPMEQAAKEVLGATIAVNCPNDGVVMNLVPGGISRRTNKPYKPFYSCPKCSKIVNA